MFGLETLRSLKVASMALTKGNPCNRGAQAPLKEEAQSEKLA